MYRFAAQLFHILRPAEQDTENDEEEEADGTSKANKPQSAPKEKSSSSATGDRRLSARNSAPQRERSASIAYNLNVRFIVASKYEYGTINVAIKTQCSRDRRSLDYLNSYLTYCVDKAKECTSASDHHTAQRQSPEA